jgi:hypothetical protein
MLAAKRSYRPGRPLSSCDPRSENFKPAPATRSVTRTLRCQEGSFALRNSPCRRIGGPGIVEIHALHLASKRAYSSRNDKPVTTRNLHGRKLIKNTGSTFGLAGRDRSPTHAELRDVVCSPRSGTIKGAASPVRAGISPLESDFKSAGISRTCPCVPGILSQHRRHRRRPANKHGRAQKQRMKRLGRHSALCITPLPAWLNPYPPLRQAPAQASRVDIPPTSASGRPIRPTWSHKPPALALARPPPCAIRHR